MTRLRLSYASTYDYDRTRALADGRVVPDGIDLNFMVLPTIEDVFWRTARYQDFDSSEFSFQSYLVSKASARGDTLPLIAIPVFPSRVFRHSAIYVNADSGIEEPEDLKGKTVGVPAKWFLSSSWAGPPPTRASRTPSWGNMASRSPKSPFSGDCRPTLISRKSSGCPSVKRLRISASTGPGVKKSVSMPRFHQRTR